ncbi:hypothetical protein BDW22DRAFT_583207 [Trametopsis cervina]|nr:hypothetical protein BDW22DRAFT_583207 [Trametopsis cervina]
MAQPVFDEHPLQDYFRETGEQEELMPGSHPEYAAESSSSGHHAEPLSSIGLFVSHVLSRVESLHNLLSASSPSGPSDAFAERFKYDVISSSLLSTSLASSPQPGRRSFVSELPDRLNPIPGDHSRTSSSSIGHSDDVFAPRDASGLSHEPGDLRLVVAIISAAVLAFAAGFEMLSMLLVALALYVTSAVKPEVEKSNAATLTLDALNELISAGNVWDSAVNEAMSIIEKDERSPNSFYSPTSPQSPLLSLRVSLQTSLNTTQSQCDNVRQLLAALTSPQQLSQLSEMYAPATPIKSTFPSLASAEHLRPMSDPLTDWRRRTISMPQTSNKRATWNGSQAVSGGLLHPLRQRQKRQSELRSLFSAPEGHPLSAPSTPVAHKVLHDVKEEDDSSEPESEPFYPGNDDVFGVAALNLRRKRRSAVLDTFGTPPPSYSSQTLGHTAHSSISSSFASPSRFTLLQTNRRPFSLSSLSLALHGALAAKRYSCAHLLALRFEEDADDDAYWEDVRSIMALLTSTFSDASGNLMAALDEAEKKRMKEERPSTESLAALSREGSVSPESRQKDRLYPPPMRSMAEMTSFAPLPSHLTRFAAHVDAISSALNDARDHLEQCVASIREGKFEDANASMLPNPDGSTLDPFAADEENESQNTALQAYDRLRKELGFAFRECERGRERLLDVISASQPGPAPVEEEEISPTMPSLAPDTSSEDSHGDAIHAVHDRLEAPEVNVIDLDQPFDDATEHLLRTASSQHLPRPGIEQVYEADSTMAKFTRERSKLSREERIKLMKERRSSGTGLGIAAPPESRSQREQWGPGGEVVQELKDVIWQVGEKRRKLIEEIGLDSVDRAERSEISPEAVADAGAGESVVS